MIKVNIGGCNNKHPQNFRVCHKEGSKDYLLLLTKTEACFDINGKVYDMPPGTFVLFDREVPRHYYNKHGDYINDWIHFDLVGDSTLIKTFNIPFNEPISLCDLSTVAMIINLIINELHTNGHYQEAVIDHYMQILLCKVAEQILNVQDKVKSHPLYLKMNKIRSNIYNEPHKEWCIEDLCKELNMSMSYFQHVYKEIFQISCMSDVISARMEQAKFYLVYSEMAINSVAEICGYSNPIHFSRQFKQHMGFSPRDYRNKISSTNFNKKNEE